jgi:hypothetical protein
MTGFGITDENAPKDPAGGIIARIRALLAKAANDAATDAERDAYTAKAAELSAKYGVDIAAAGGSAANDMTLKEYEVEGDFDRECAELIYYVAQALGCRPVIILGGVAVLGYTADVQRCDILATCLGLQMNSGASRVAGLDAVVSGWMLGFTSEACRRLRDAEQRARQLADPDLLAKRKARLDEVFGEEFPHISTERSRKIDWRGFGQGQNAARTADIGQARMRNRQAIG